MSSLVVDRQPKPLETATMLMMRPRPHRLGVVESVEEEGVEEVVAMASRHLAEEAGAGVGRRWMSLERIRTHDLLLALDGSLRNSTHVVVSRTSRVHSQVHIVCLSL